MTPRQELIKYLLDFGFLEEEVVSILNDKTIKQSKVNLSSWPPNTLFS